MVVARSIAVQSQSNRSRIILVVVTTALVGIKGEVYRAVVSLRLMLLLLGTIAVVMDTPIFVVVVVVVGGFRLDRQPSSTGAACRRCRWLVVCGGRRGGRNAATAVCQLAQVPMNALEGEALTRVAAPTSKHHVVHVVWTSGRLLQQDSVLQKLNHLPFEAAGDISFFSGIISVNPYNILYKNVHTYTQTTEVS